jgi:uncharacterized membrane protein
MRRIPNQALPLFGGLLLGTAVFSLLVAVGLWAGILLMLIFTLGMLVWVAHDWKETIVQWRNSLARERVAANILGELLCELAERDPDRANELATQYHQLCWLVEMSDIHDVVKESREDSGW